MADKEPLTVIQICVLLSIFTMLAMGSLLFIEVEGHKLFEYLLYCLD